MAAEDVLNRLKGEKISTDSEVSDMETIEQIPLGEGYHDIEPFFISRAWRIDLEPLKGTLALFYTSEAHEADNWVKENVIDAGKSLLGFDAEWPPMIPGQRIQPVSTIQISTDSKCLITHICHMKNARGKVVFPKHLKRVLEDMDIFKVGRGIDYDHERLWLDYDVNTVGFVDLRNFISLLGTTVQGNGLADLSKALLNFPLNKNPEVRCRDWREELDYTHAKYAALDAWAGLRIFRRIMKDVEVRNPLGFEYELSYQLQRQRCSSESRLSF